MRIYPRETSYLNQIKNTALAKRYCQVNKLQYRLEKTRRDPTINVQEEEGGEEDKPFSL